MSFKAITMMRKGRQVSIVFVNIESLVRADLGTPPRRHAATSALRYVGTPLRRHAATSAPRLQLDCCMPGFYTYTDIFATMLLFSRSRAPITP